MKYLIIIAAIIAAWIALLWGGGSEIATAAERKSVKISKLQARIDNGRYVAFAGQCNDCHTPGFPESGGKLPESEWLVGSSAGFRGDWGTTYPINIRLLLSTQTEDEWVNYARSVKGAPPMPWWSLHNMREDDLRDLYQFVRSLGVKGQQAPAALPPGVVPTTPYILFKPVMPAE